MFQWTGRVLRLLLASLLVSIAIEWIGMHLWWTDLGPEHSRQMVRTESRFLDRNITNSWVESKPVAAVTRTISVGGAALAESRIVTYGVDGAYALARRLNSSPRWRRLRIALSPYLQATRNISQLYAIRLTVLCLAAPLFVLLLWVGLVDGLVQRDLRRWGGGRESAYVYHYAKRSNLVFVAIGAIVYLAMPISIHPAIILMPFATACAVSVSLTASRFKKYL
jgi:integrating conjugative element membrane protein (TIGR03747 family)